VRVNSPIGILRADFGITNTGDSRLQFGVGHRF
jgi:outer membrane protein insertion porin family